MGEPASKEKSILEQWMELTEDVVGEIVAGDLYVSPRPSPKHIRTASVLGVKIGGPFDIGGPGGWWILDEPEIHLDSHILVPDLLVSRSCG